MGPELFLIASAVISAGAAVAQGIQASNASKANAKALEADALATRRAAALEEQKSRRQSAQLLAKQRARFAKAGVQSTGTPLLVQSDSAAQGEFEAQLIRFGGEVGAMGLRNQAGIQRANAKNQRTSGFISAGESLLGSAAGGAFGNLAPSKPKPPPPKKKPLIVGSNGMLGGGI